VFHHLTLIRLKADAPARAHADAIVAARALDEQIQSIVSMSCGPAIRNGGHDWDLAFEFGFTDPAGFDAFAAHPAHDEFVARQVHPFAEVVMSVDYDDEAST
jgi:Stress responsive A/B Barrel Domain